MTTELTTQGGMHIEPDEKTGAIAASVVNEDIKKVQDQQEEKAAATEAPAVVEDAEDKKPVDPRQAIMDTIYAKRADQFKDELEYAAQINAGATFAPAIDDATAEDKAKATTSEEPVKKDDQEQVQSQQQARPKKQYIINGQSVELTEEELAQLATRSLHQTQQFVQQQQRVYQQPQQQVVHPQAQQQIDPEADRLRDIARKITYGSEDESVKALKDFADHTVRSVQRTNQGPTADQIIQHATQSAVQQIQFQNNLDAIASEYPDVFERRSATLVAADYVNSLRNKYHLLGAPRTDIELYREACTLTRGEFKPSQDTTQQHTQRQTAVQVTPNANKIERKRTAPQPPASVSRVLPAQIDKAPTGSDIVEAMRKSRGQSAMN